MGKYALETRQPVHEWEQQIEQFHTQLASLETRASSEAPQASIIHETFEALYASAEQLHSMLATVIEQQSELEVSHTRLETERQRYRDLFEFAPDGYLVTDAKGKISEANRAIGDMLNVEPHMLQGRLLLAFVLPEDQPMFMEMLARLNAVEPVRAWNVRMQQRGNGVLNVAVVVQAARDEQGSITSIRWLLRDVTAQIARAQALQASKTALAEANATLEQRVIERTADLRASEEKLRFITENLDDVFWLISPDLSTIHYVSPSYERLFGRTCDSLYADPTTFFDAVHPDDLDTVQPPVSNKADREHEMVFRIVRPDGSVRWLRVHSKPIFDAAGTIMHRVGITKDITEQKEHEAQIEALAYSDGLTGLANRRRLFDAGTEALMQAQADETHLALLYLDLSRFKAVNDTWGHSMGDELLRIVAARLRTCVRPSDLAARPGGDEFAVLLPGADTEQALTVARRILAELDQPFALHGQQIKTGCSIGIATLANKPRSFSQLVSQADEAMYHAKATDCQVHVYAHNAYA
jgi:diguanylate cyclase (GGDEF)-like protein/PAS domain S-box-containing protein